MHRQYTLFYSPAACSMAVHAVLHAIGADFQLVKVDIHQGENRTADYLAHNPLGQVPVLIVDGVPWKESAAMMIHLLDSHHHPLLPPSGETRRKAMQWLLFCNTTLHQAYSASFLISGHLKEPHAADTPLRLISRRIQKLWDYVESEVQAPFLCGDAPTAGDILMAVIANWSSVVTPPVSPGENTRMLCRRVAALPYFHKALTAEGVDYTV